MERRTFLTRGLTVTGGVAVAGIAGDPARAEGSRDSVRVLRTVEAASAGGHYTPNRAPLRPAPFLKLPPGSVRPKGWLRRQLALQVPDAVLRLPEPSAGRGVPAGLGRVPLGRHDRQRLLGLQPDRGRPPPRPGPQDPRRLSGLCHRPADPPQREPRPGVPRADPVRRAGRRPGVARGDVPELRRGDGHVRPVPRRIHPSAYGTARDTYNRTTFTPVRATAFRVEAHLADGVSGGILEWTMEQA